MKNHFLKKIRTDTFLKNSVIFTIASLVASALNYFYYPIIAQFVTLSDFGEIQIITSLLMQLSAVFTGLNLINIYLINNKKTKNNEINLVTSLQRYIFWFFVIISIALIASSGFLQNFFHFDSIWPFLLVVPSLLVNAIAVFWTAYVQARQDFITLSAYNIIVGLMKIVSSVLLVILGFRVGGAIIGLALGLLSGLLFVSFTVKYPLPKLLHTFRFPTKIDFKLLHPYLRFIVVVIISLILITLLLSIDTLIVKHIFPADFAGQYAGISTVARIIFYASSPLVAIMIPALRVGQRKNNLQILKKTLIISMSICIVSIIIFGFFSETVITLLMGEKFVALSYLLLPLSILASISTLSCIILNYSLSLGSKIGFVQVLVSTFLSIVLAMLIGLNIQGIIYAISFSILVGVIITIIYHRVIGAKQKAELSTN